MGGAATALFVNAVNVLEGICRIGGVKEELLLLYVKTPLSVYWKRTKLR